MCDILLIVILMFIILLCVIRLIVIRLNVIRPIVIRLNVVAPFVLNCYAAIQLVLLSSRLEKRKSFFFFLSQSGNRLIAFFHVATNAPAE